jgi:hypothetical protein
MSTTTSRAPAAAMPKAMAFPLPCPAPVTRANRPFKIPFHIKISPWINTAGRLF